MDYTSEAERTAQIKSLQERIESTRGELIRMTNESINKREVERWEAEDKWLAARVQSLRDSQATLDA
jgi:hypothetical protein